MIKRNPFLAAILSFLTPGTGQIYNGQLKKGIVFLFVPMLILGVSSELGLLDSFPALFKMLWVVAAFNLYVLVDSVTISIKRKTIQKTLLNQWYVYVIIIFLMPILFLSMERNVLGIRPYITEGPSMAPTLMYNSRFMASTDISQLKHGDILIFNAPAGKMYIKRIIGLGGDTIEIKNNTLYLNGIKTVEPFKQEQKDIDFPEYKVPEGSYFVLGDNRLNSIDSRAFGPITKDKIVGKALFVFYENGKLVFDKKL